jgi:hypothetical protein
VCGQDGWREVTGGDTGGVTLQEEEDKRGVYAYLDEY